MQQLFYQKGGDKTQTAVPIDATDARVECNINGKNYFLEVRKNNEYTPAVIKTTKTYGEVTITVSLAPIMFITTFENLLQELQKAGVVISRSPTFDLITGSSDKYYVIVINATVEKDGKPVVDKYSSRIILINESRINDINTEFYINDIPFLIKSLYLQKGPSYTPEEEKEKKEVEKEEVLVYPNPAKRGEIVNIELSGLQGKYDIELYSSTGQKICKIDSIALLEKGEKTAINFKVPEGLAAGTYFIKIEQQGKTITCSLLVN
ncbi:MAG: T9SS type A sorting domain-containing protein [Candidatus Micrarchaeota archaeon]|nr:T9SS type A sorting domain-containing protein [Candidatus Micrarchaeota archaeon]